MTRTLLKLCLLTAAMATAADPAGSGTAGPAAAALEARLRAQRPEVTRWELAELSGGAKRAAPQGELALVGSLGARTAVRFSDGRVRWYSVVGIAPVMTSAHSLAAGAEIVPADLETAEHDVIALGCEPLMALGDMRWRTTRRLAAGEPLCKSSIEPAPQVQRGRDVTLSTERGPIRVSRVLVANNDAWTGERVRLRDPASGETVPAIVTGNGAARVNSEEVK